MRGDGQISVNRRPRDLESHDDRVVNLVRYSIEIFTHYGNMNPGDVLGEDIFLTNVTSNAQASPSQRRRRAAVIG
jgi:hypothetical protein